MTKPANPPRSTDRAADSEVMWSDLYLAFDEDGLLSGWIVTTSRLRTPAGVRVGTAVATLRKIYGGRLEISEGHSDSGPFYTVQGVSMLGLFDWHRGH